MTAQTYSATFDGYWREPKIAGIPDETGVYLVYTCNHNVQENAVTLKKLIYIGQADDAQNRISTHNRWDDWRKQLSKGETICFAFAPVAKACLDRVEAAFIFKHKPPCNSDCVNNFSFDETTVNSDGKCALITAPFTVKRT